MKLAHILLADDSRLGVELTLDTFRAAHFAGAAHVAWSGEGILNYFTGTGRTPSILVPLPDFLLLDLNLPGTVGRELLRRIRKTPVLQRLPVVVWSSFRRKAISS